MEKSQAFNMEQEETPDELRPEYRFDYSKSRPNRFAGKNTDDRLVVILDPDVAQVFKTPESVNNVLRALILTMPTIHELKSVFKAKFLAAIRKQIKLGNLPQQEPHFLDNVYKKEWVIYAKRPFGGAPQVIEYLGRYTHKVAISNHRLIKVDQHQTIFCYKDYKDNARQKTMTLENEEFLRRFSQHILPSGFTKIRHFGFHSGAAHLQIDTLMLELTGEIRPKFDRKLALKNAKEKSSFTSELCPCCNKKTMQTILVWHAAKPPPTVFKNPLAEIEF